MTMGKDVIKSTFLSSKIVRKGDYDYFVNPISEGNPPITKELLDEITDNIIEISDLDCDVILAPEAMSIQYGAALTLRTGIPFQIIRKRATGLLDEISFSKSTGYAESKMYLTSIPPRTKVVIVDDVLSTGGTLRSMVRALRGRSIEVTEIIIVLDRSHNSDALSKELGIPIRTVLEVDISNGMPIVIE